MKSFTEEFLELTNTTEKILITAHMNPDDDAIASVLVMYNFLKTTYPSKESKIIFTGEKQNRWAYFQNFDAVTFVPDIAEVADDFDLIIFLDGSNFGRFSKNPEKLGTSKPKKFVLIITLHRPMSLT